MVLLQKFSSNILYCLLQMDLETGLLKVAMCPLKTRL